MNVILNQTPKNFVLFDDIKQKIREGKGILVQSWTNAKKENQVSVFTQAIQDCFKCGFINFRDNTDRSGCSSSLDDFFVRVHNGAFTGLHWFENLQEFAEAVIENKWN